MYGRIQASGLQNTNTCNFLYFFETFISTLEIIIMCQHSSLHHNHTDICNMVSLSIILERNSNNSLCEKKT